MENQTVTEANVRSIRLDTGGMKSVLKALQTPRLEYKVRVTQLLSKLDIPEKQPGVVTSRLDRLVSLQAIRGYRAVFDWTKLGRPVSFFVLVQYPARVTSKIARDLVFQISRIPEVEEAHLITGEYDILVKARAKDAGDAAYFAIKRLRPILGRGSKTVTCLAFESPEPHPLEIPVSKVHP